LKTALYVSPSGYVLVFCSVPTQGVALGCAMKLLRGNKQETNIPVFQQARQEVGLAGSRIP
jgi:hypothetical protein